MSFKKIKKAIENPDVIDKEDLLDLQRVIGTLKSEASSGTETHTGVVLEVISNPDNYLKRPFYVAGAQAKMLVDPLDPASSQVDILVGDVLSGRAKKDEVSGTPLQTLYINSSATDVMPLNSCIAFLSDDVDGTTASKPVLCYPFFPPHLSLPLKPGEHIWIMKESSTVADANYYWMCRKPAIRQVDDLNITHHEREREVSNALTSLHAPGSPGAPLKDENIHTVNNFGPAAAGNSFSMEEFDRIHQGSVAYREEFTGEVVPRQAKRCGDLLIQGSNNSHIMLGTEKFQTARLSVRGGGSFEDSGLDPTDMTPHSSAADTISSRGPLGPAIDICLFRKSREIFDIRNTLVPAARATDANVVASEPGTGHAGLGYGLGAVKGKRTGTGKRLEHFEVDKTRELNKDRADNLFVTELEDSDIYNVIGRIYMSNLKNIDKLLLLEPHTGGGMPAWGTGKGIPEDLLSLGNFGSTVVIGPNTRVIGTESVKIQQINCQGLIQISQDGSIVLAAGTGTGDATRGNGAKITLTAGGDIILYAPGHIKLIPDAGFVHCGADFGATDAGAKGTIPVGGVPAGGGASIGVGSGDEADGDGRGNPLGTGIGVPTNPFHGFTPEACFTSTSGELEEFIGGVPFHYPGKPPPMTSTRYAKKVIMR